MCICAAAKRMRRGRGHFARPFRCSRPSFRAPSVIPAQAGIQRADRRAAIQDMSIQPAGPSFPRKRES